jgi:hypothetical protein
MTEKDIILKIQELKQIKPNQNWVVFTKQKIFADNDNIDYGYEKGLKISISDISNFLKFVLKSKAIITSLLAIFVLIGIFIVSRESVPGSLFYSARKVMEKSEKSFADEKEFNIKLVNNRLDDLIKIARKNSTKNLAAAISEYKSSVDGIVKDLNKEDLKNNPEEMKKIAKQLKDIESKVSEAKSLGIEVSDNYELDLALLKLIKAQVDDLEKRTLFPEQAKLLEEIKMDINNNKLATALEKILLINNNQQNEENGVGVDKNGSQENK